MESAKVFSLSRVGKRFGHRKVLQNISFDVEAGDFLLLLGSNGAGKSTLVKLLSSLMRPSSGDLHFKGRPLSSSGESARRVLGVISHDSQFYGDLTAKENLRVFGTLRGVAALPGRIVEAMTELRLDGFPEVPVRAFSSGMLKRLAFARLALYNPTVLLLDEPYSGLDQESVKLLDLFLERFKKEGGTTIMVTHQFTNGVAFCNRILILNRGTLVYNRPAEGVTGEECARLLADFSGTKAPAPAPE